MDSFRISDGRRCDRNAVFDQISISKPFQLQDPVKCSGVSLNIGQNLTHRPKHLAILYTDSPSMKAIFSCGLALLVAHSCPNPGKQLMIKPSSLTNTRQAVVAKLTQSSHPTSTQPTSATSPFSFFLLARGSSPRETRLACEVVNDRLLVMVKHKDLTIPLNVQPA